MQSLLDGHLYAVNAATGAVLANIDSGGQSSGPAISRGQVYLGTGDVFSATFDPLGQFGYTPGPGTITALGVGDAVSDGVPFEVDGLFSADIQGSHGMVTVSGTANIGGTFTGNFPVKTSGNHIEGTPTFVFTDANGNQIGTLSFTYEVRVDRDTGLLEGDFVVTGGTGVFAGVSGGGEICYPLGHDQPFMMDGLLTF
jgi:hypothetical protein